MLSVQPIRQTVVGTASAGPYDMVTERDFAFCGSKMLQF